MIEVKSQQCLAVEMVPSTGHDAHDHLGTVEGIGVVGTWFDIAWCGPFWLHSES